MRRIEHGDCRKIIPTLGVTVDAVVTDPPYHLLPTARRFGKANSAPVTVPEFYAKDGKSKGPSPYLRQSAGFMGQQWDGGDIAFLPETWATIGTALRPGGFLVAFGGPRTYHRMASAIEDAGFVIQDCLMWLFATGFPKRRDMLKPAYEPIVLAYKPGGKRTMQVDECRVGTEVLPEIRAGDAQLGTFERTDMVTPERVGRWPANICLSPTGGEYELHPGVTDDQKRELYRWLSENP